MIHYSEDKRMLEYGLMKSYPGIFCFSTTRHGGYSTGEYASFNCNNYCGDVMENILKNRSLLCSLLPGTEKELVIPHQVHRAEVRVVDREFCKQPESCELLCWKVWMRWLLTFLASVSVCRLPIVFR